ncbi:MAG: OsmC family protein [Clostridia bacterium]|nr:OsmC family protein [Clostridia bacterium]
MALMEVSFPGGKIVDASMKGFTVRTDQPERAGGSGTAPAPFDLFLSSIGTCTGIYALNFCESKGLSTEGLKLTLDVEKDSETRMLSKIRMVLTLPEDFPPKYERAILRAMNLCAVKRHMLEAPEFEIVTE